MNQTIDPRLLKIAQDNLDKLPPDVQQQIGELVAQARKMGVQNKAQDDFMAFVNYVWPTFIHGRHHQRMARAFEKVARGECKRLIINMPPRHTKSEFASYLLPAWFLGKFPHKKIIQASYNTELAIGFGRKVRNLVDSDKFKDVFPNVELRVDSKAAGRWNTNHNGDYFAAGVGANLAGRGADICITPNSIVYCEKRGPIEARYVRLGDKILGSDGYGEVLAVIDSKHSTTVNVDGAEFSKQHPIWTVDNGWVNAELLTTNSWLQTINLFDRLASFITTRGICASTYNRAKKFFKTGIAIRLARKLCPALRITRRYGEGYRIEQKSSQSMFSWKEQIVLRILLGIRRADSITHVDHNPAPFLNFMVAGHHTFIVNPYLTHNCIIDDPHSEQQAILAESDPEIYDKTFEWYSSGPRQRLQPGGAIILVMTRWGARDLTGQILKAAAQRTGEDWELIELPAILPSGNPLWPEFWSMRELDALRKELPSSKWMAQYQQQPTSDTAAIIKREWWNVWDEDSPPPCEFILQTWDTAFTKNERSDYSACTTWGVFYLADDTGLMQANIILLDYFKRRMEFPELKQKTFEMWKEWEPDSVIIEAKASGAPLVFELRAMGIPVQEFTPVRGGGDKIARANSVADIFASGRVWAPNTHWAEELVDEVASFPAGEHDDGVDATVMAMLRFRKGGFLRLPTDEEDEQQYFRRKVAYY